MPSPKPQLLAFPAKVLKAATPIIPDPASSYPRLRGGTALVAAPQFAAPEVA